MCGRTNFSDIVFSMHPCLISRTDNSTMKLPIALALALSACAVSTPPEPETPSVIEEDAVEDEILWNKPEPVEVSQAVIQVEEVPDIEGYNQCILKYTSNLCKFWHLDME